MFHRRVRLAGFVSLVLGCALPALAVQAPQWSFPDNFDLRPAVDERALSSSRGEVRTRIAERFGSDVVARWGDLSARPHYLFRPRGILGVLPAREPAEAAREFLRSGRGVFGMSDAEIEELEAAKVYRTTSTGTTHVLFVQRRDGISVFRGQVRINIDDRGGVINVGGEYFPGLRGPGEPDVGAREALRTAAVGVGLSEDVPPVVASETTGERLTRFAGSPEYLEPPRARLVLLPQGPDRARLTWEVIVWEAVTGADHRYRVLVDAATGAPVLRELMTLYVADPATARGLVFDSKDPDSGPHVERSFEGDPVASPEHWVSDGQTKSQGNNVAARVDWGGRNTNSEAVMADGGDALEFLFPFVDSYANGGSYRDDRDSAITNVFYWGNLIHDYWYSFGFDEAAGNYQDDNFGRGGAGNDHVNADAQDWASSPFFRNNANWSPTNDGNPPRTNYYLWTDPRRDGAFDAKVIMHEFGHGLSTRLVGGPGTQCLGGAQGGGMGEGWSDWVAVNYFADASDDPAGPATVGEYVTGDFDDGIRRYPYHYDMAIDPLTYEDLCDGGSCAVHDEGEIWASVLWDMRHDLIQQLGFDEGRLRAEFLVIDAMKLSPCSPNFVTMRDSILQADEQRYGGQHECLIRSAFARRGLGALASSNGTGSDATADFSLIRPVGGLGFAGDSTTLTWTDRDDATLYRVARGSFDEQAANNTFDDAACIGETASPSYSDADVPVAGGFYYLVALDDACFASDYGAASDGTRRVVEPCP